MFHNIFFLQDFTHFVYSFSFVKCPGQKQTAHCSMPGRKFQRRMVVTLVKSQKEFDALRTAKEGFSSIWFVTYFFVNRIISLPMRIEPL